MTAPKPMDPKRLALAHAIAARRGPRGEHNPLIGELLADSDYQAAEAKRWRARSPVTADDVELAHYSIPRGHIVCKAAGLSRIRETDTYEDGERGRRVKLNHGAVRAVADIAAVTGRTGWDILDLMASMRGEP